MSHGQALELDDSGTILVRLRDREEVKYTDMGGNTVSVIGDGKTLYLVPSSDAGFLVPLRTDVPAVIQVFNDSFLNREKDPFTAAIVNEDLTDAGYIETQEGLLGTAQANLEALNSVLKADSSVKELISSSVAQSYGQTL